MLAEAAPADLCTHAIAFFAKRPIKASDDAWKGLRANACCTSLSAGKVNSNGCAAAGLAVSLERVRGLRDRVRGDDATGGDCCGRRAAASCGDSLQPAGLGVS